MIWRCRDRVFDLRRRAEVMGVLNVTPDSFSDGGEFADPGAALSRAREMIEEGAAILDIGGESTRPGAEAVGEREERDRVLPAIVAIKRDCPGACLSIDTSKAAVARAAVEAGADIVNDVTGFTDPAMRRVVAETGAGAVAMHMRGSPRTMQANPAYGDLLAEIREFFQRQHAALIEAGTEPEQIAHDPGIGFGKTLEHNLALLRNLDRLAVENRPLLLGVSRKSLFAKILGDESMERRAAPTTAVTALARQQGVMLHRVHDVRANVDALRVVEGVLG